MKRRFISPLIFVYPIMVQEKPMEPVGMEDVARTLYAKDKCIADMEAVSTEVMTPKEYGIKLLTKKYKYGR
jgi:hypothetical protein